MKINFNIKNLSVDLSYVFENENTKKWWYNNVSHKIPFDTKPEELTDSQKISLVKLAIYEGLIEEEDLWNTPSESFEII